MRGSRLGKRGKNSFFDEEEQNPMEGVANLVDAMLVLACGLMMAIISFYNVDINGINTKAEELKQEQRSEAIISGNMPVSRVMEDGFCMIRTTM